MKKGQRRASSFPAQDFNAFLRHMGWTEVDAAKHFGAARNSIRKWRREGAPRYIALAAIALATRLKTE